MDRERLIGFQIRTLSNLIRRCMDNSATKKYADQLTGVHGWVVGYLYHHSDQDIYQRDIERQFSIRRSTVTQILQLMEKNGLVQRLPVHHDARLKRLVLTPKGEELHLMVEKDMDAMERRLEAGISKQEMDAFFNTMQKIQANLNEISGPKQGPTEVKQ